MEDKWTNCKTVTRIGNNMPQIGKSYKN